MKLSRLRLLNFRQHADTEIEFELGLTGIIGPNGAGKSTILEAVAWALYGGDTARGGKDSIRFTRAPARASVRVELDFELGGHRYGIQAVGWNLVPGKGSFGSIEEAEGIVNLCGNRGKITDPLGKARHCGKHRVARNLACLFPTGEKMRPIFANWTPKGPAELVQVQRGFRFGEEVTGIQCVVAQVFE